jgi:hypothetical protein
MYNVSTLRIRKESLWSKNQYEVEAFGDNIEKLVKDNLFITKRCGPPLGLVLPLLS